MQSYKNLFNYARYKKIVTPKTIATITAITTITAIATITAIVAIKKVETLISASLPYYL